MPKVFKTFVHVLLMLLAFQVCNINAVQCYAGADGGLDIVTLRTHHNHGSQEYFHSQDHKKHDMAKIPHSHTKHKLVKKIFPAKCSIPNEPFVVEGISFISSLEHHTAYPSYCYLYYRTYNPPPSC
jgi:hypothetical protein